MPAGTSNAAPSATPARNARPRWARASTSTAASVIVGATPYKAKARHTRNPVSLNVCTTSDPPKAMTAPASVGTSSSAVSNPQPNRVPAGPRRGAPVQRPLAPPVWPPPDPSG